MEGKSTTENKTPEDEILELIQLVDLNRDNEGKPLFRERDIFRGSLSTFVGLFVLMLMASFFLFSRLISYGDYLLVLVTIIAILLAFLSLMMQIVEVNVVEIRFKRALRLRTSFTESQKLILKALIKMRSKHPKFALKDVYSKNKEMFTEKKLMEILYT